MRPCRNHKPVKHGDGLEAWCDACALTIKFELPHLEDDYWPRYRARPTEVSAVLYDGTNAEVIHNFSKGVTFEQDDCVKIETLEGTITASVGDYVVRGTRGEFYPCKPDIFESKYDRVG